MRWESSDTSQKAVLRKHPVLVQRFNNKDVYS